jgi:hypothetical protein
MDKLSQFYIDLSTDMEKMAQFNHGETQSMLTQNRRKMLSAAGVEAVEDIIHLDQKQLQALMTKQLSEQTSEWSNLNSLAPNSDNNDNRVSRLGRRTH